MKQPLRVLLLLTSLLSTSASAQLLTNGNSQFPSCASTCQLLNQAAQACGGTASADQATWACFCQSAYLRNLYSSPTGICDAYCTNPSDNQQVMTWYKGNCGTDLGASEHANAAETTSSATAGVATTAAASTTSGAVLPTTSSSGGTVTPDNETSSGGSWWDQHYVCRLPPVLHMPLH